MANLIQKFRKWRRDQKKAKQKQQSSTGFIRQLFRSQRGRYSSVKMAKEQKNFEFQELKPGDNASLCSDVQIMDPNDELPNHDATDVDCTVEKSDCVHYHVMDLKTVDTGDHSNTRTRSPSPEKVSQGEEARGDGDPLDNSDFYTKRAEQLGNCDSNSLECLDVYFKPTEGRKSFRRSASVRRIKRAADTSWNVIKTAFDDTHKPRTAIPQLSALGKALGSAGKS